MKFVQSLEESKAALGKRVPQEDKSDPKGDPEKKIKDDKAAKEKTSIDSKRLYVYNFPYSVTKEELRTVFEKFGKLSECIIPLDAEHKSKGYGYVSFEEENDSIRSFSELDNTVVFGRILHIKPSYESRSKPRT